MHGKRIVLDTNIWISSIISKRLAELTGTILNNELKVYVSPELMRETSYNLRKEKIKKYLSGAASEYLSQIRTLTIMVKPLQVFKRSPDPGDNFLFDLAIKIKADYLVTGDKLLFQTKVEGLSIITLKEFNQMAEK